MPDTRFELVIFALQVRRLANLAKQADFTKMCIKYWILQTAKKFIIIIQPLLLVTLYEARVQV